MVMPTSAPAVSPLAASLSAVFSGVKEIRASMEQAEHNLARGRRTILFVDEIHRFNKSQQDGLLPFVESGLVTFVGATTENPSFEVNSALLSRAQVYVLETLSDDELRLLVKRALDQVLTHLQMDEVAIDTLVGYADGDARRPARPGQHPLPGPPAAGRPVALRAAQDLDEGPRRRPPAATSPAA